MKIWIPACAGMTSSLDDQREAPGVFQIASDQRVHDGMHKRHVIGIVRNCENRRYGDKQDPRLARHTLKSAICHAPWSTGVDVKSLCPSPRRAFAS
jgi:hypothetical protein